MPCRCLPRARLVGAVVAVHFVVGSDRVRLGRLPGDRRCARIDPVVAEHDVVGVTGEQLVLAEAAVHRVDSSVAERESVVRPPSDTTKSPRPGVDEVGAVAGADVVVAAVALDTDIGFQLSLLGS